MLKWEEYGKGQMITPEAFYEIVSHLTSVMIWGPLVHMAISCLYSNQIVELTQNIIAQF